MVSMVMGTIVDVKCSSFVLPTTDFPDALAALKSLAEVCPEELHEPARTLAAADLPAAFAAEGWVSESDASGLTRLWYGGDKSPPESDEEWPRAYIAALAPFVSSAAFQIFFDGELMFTFAVKDGELTDATDADDDAPAPAAVAP